MAALEGGSMEINAAPDIDVESMPRPKITQKEEKPYINVEVHFNFFSKSTEIDTFSI